TPNIGPKHDYGPQLWSAIHPRTFLSEKQQQHGAPCVSWKNNCLQISSFVLQRNHTSSTATVQKCKKTALRVTKEVRHSQGKSNRPVSTDNHKEKLVETPRPIPSILRWIGGRLHVLCKRQTPGIQRTEDSKNLHFHTNAEEVTEVSVHTSVSKGSQTPNTSSVPASPNVETPEIAHCSSTSSPDVLHLLFLQNLTKAPPHTPNTSVLCTPEKDYGLRVTWRHRKTLIKLLMLLTEAGVANEWT
ncbi:RAD9, HUS1, RAD1-interacting nuclear orphan protein 1, partial [Xyrauchen texanus]|uniref:RAD9, HUS1, RAD1-interacting nuclear orphan protein 1 n=1 Tax=Xyrauchen texanus TaxID=154827 RepID=UPI002241F238